MGSKFLADAGFQGNDTESYFIASMREGSKKKLPVLVTVLREHNKIYSLYNERLTQLQTKSIQFYNVAWNFLIYCLQYCLHLIAASQQQSLR